MNARTKINANIPPSPQIYVEKAASILPLKTKELRNQELKSLKFINVPPNPIVPHKREISSTDDFLDLVKENEPQWKGLVKNEKHKNKVFVLERIRSQVVHKKVGRVFKS